MSNENTTPMNEIDKIKKEGALAALMSAFDEIASSIAYDWDNDVSAEDFDKVKQATLQNVEKLSAIVAAIEEMEADV